MARSTVPGPIVGRSTRRSCPGLGALKNTPPRPLARASATGPDNQSAALSSMPPTMSSVWSNGSSPPRGAGGAAGPDSRSASIASVPRVPSVAITTPSRMTQDCPWSLRPCSRCTSWATARSRCVVSGGLVCVSTPACGSRSGASSCAPRMAKPRASKMPNTVRKALSSPPPTALDSAGNKGNVRASSRASEMFGRSIAPQKHSSVTPRWSRSRSSPPSFSMRKVMSGVSPSGTCPCSAQISGGSGCAAATAAGSAPRPVISARLIVGSKSAGRFRP